MALFMFIFVYCVWISINGQLSNYLFLRHIFHYVWIIFIHYYPFFQSGCFIPPSVIFQRGWYLIIALFSDISNYHFCLFLFFQLWFLRWCEVVLFFSFQICFCCVTKGNISFRCPAIRDPFTSLCKTQSVEISVPMTYHGLSTSNLQHFGSFDITSNLVFLLR